MQATFERSTDGQLAVRLHQVSPDEKLLLDEFVKDAGAKAWIVDVGGNISFLPKQPEQP